MRVRALAAALLLFAFLPRAGEAQDPRRSTRGQPNEEAQIFMETFRYLLNYHLEEFNDSTLWEKAIDGLVSELGDPYATVFTPQEVDAFREGTTGNYAGIGVQITGLNDAITITAVFRGTPADQSGIIVGDEIVGVDGEGTEGWSTGQASDLIRGEVGTTVEVTVRRPGIQEPITHQIRRDSVHLGAVTAETLESDVGYVLLDRVARGSAEEMDSALAVLSDTKGLVIDLRRNPGGYLDESLALADLFLEPGDVILTTRGRTPGRWDTQAEDVARARLASSVPDVPIVVLVDRYSASAAEILAGALQDHDRALVVGERTFGKGLVQTILPLPGGRQLRLTTAEWYTPLGRSLHRDRDRDNQLLPENPDSLPSFLSVGGRELQGGGGVFPDLAVADDTLSLAEREVLSAAARAEIPLTVRIQEFGFSQAQADPDGPGVEGAAFAEFLDGLVAEGMDPEVIRTEEARDYLRWRAEMAYFERGQRLDRAFEVRAERDLVLAKALELVKRAQGQSELFAIAREESLKAEDTAQTGETATAGRGVGPR